MSNREQETSPKDQAWWAPMLLEPIRGSGERIAVAIVGCNADGEREFLPLVNPKVAQACFRDQADHLRAVLSMTIESCKSALESGTALQAWQPPLDGIFLGAVQVVEAASLGELLHLAAPLSSFLYQEPRSQLTNRPASVPWERQVKAQLLQVNQRFGQNFNVLLHLGDHYEPAAFSFLSPDFAANIVTLTPNRLKKGMEDARAKLWTLSLLEDAPNYLFRPKIRELLTGMDAAEDDSKGSKVREATEELNDEAQRRGIGVFPFSSPKDAAAHILGRVRAA